ncbi:TPA: hypothetical protein L1V86_000172 [Enterobacter cloacae]|uniref:hypothetical protein n=1 Tax=Enterobacter cloacae complex TaxID=354276 RepID=UPI001F31A1A6|nr:MULTISPECIES: hypothetical protein [Enterobacter cloacae complex]MDA4741990.1 hypothetical protein [Enterobacter hormaechei]HAS1725602.1 hypothetical protein [Enterobacter cloacae]HAV2288671.1 hypothetical protein [Enterobacter cloacae]HAV2320888.1 hypothetical protein [Enterobacter cloacae]HBN1087751.1 hypothetical protein [Enterobacter cloacae]
MKVTKETALDCLDKLKKVNDLLVVVANSIRENNSTPDEIETCIGIAWDISNSVFQSIQHDIYRQNAVECGGSKND